MKRILAACLEQTIRFQQKEPMSSSEAEQLNRAEYVRYKEQLSRSATKYKVLEETVLPEGTLEVRLKKQYNSYPCDSYMD